MSLTLQGLAHMKYKIHGTISSELASTGSDSRL